MRKVPTAFRAGVLAGVGFFAAHTAFAQSNPTPPETPWPPQWTVTAGVESLWWRDVARTGPPVLASPISWEGKGPIVHVAYDRGRRSRLHHFEGSFTSTGGFELRSPVLTEAGPHDDGASRFSGRYEYRRYPWRDLWMDGFDLGVGVEGSFEHLSFDRHFEPGIELQKGLNNLGAAIVVAARLNRSERWGLLASWGNGITLGRSTARHRNPSETTLTGWGGGWQSNLELRGDVRIAARVRVTGAWFTSGEGHAGWPDTYTYGRSRYTVGVTYGR